MRSLPFLLCCFVLAVQLNAQSNMEQQGQTVWSDFIKTGKKANFLYVENISISGNKKTKEQIVLRELFFIKDGLIPKKDLDIQLKQSRQQLMNTTLFVDVQIIPITTDSTIRIQINLKERWYLFPLPYFRLIDRNFNQWWVQQQRSLERVNYGIKFIQNNTTGRNDNLNIWLISGYTQQVTLRYDVPLFGKKLNQGFNIGLSHGTQKEINISTANDKQQFFKYDQSFIKKQTKIDFTYSYRPRLKKWHSLRISYNDESIADTVFKINPQYFSNHTTQFKYIDFNYRFKYYNADANAYPTNGFLFEGNVYKRGLTQSASLWMLYSRAIYAVPIAKKAFLHFEGLAQLKFPSNNAFSDQRLFGYGHFQMRGLEYNVIDGMNGAMLKSSIHQQLVKFEIKNPFPSKTHDRIPFRIYLKTYTDLGYASIANPLPTNTLNNRLLKTWGFGIDIVSIYDFVFKIEYSFNQLNNHGLYLQSRNDF
jgi:outer membrane protein assembly factor BamA